MINSIDSLYLHFPFCNTGCNYCDFFCHKSKSLTLLDTFENTLLRSYDKHLKFLAQYNKTLNLDSLHTLYIGGGTPSLWGKRGVSFLCEQLGLKNLLPSSCEFTLEINPKKFSSIDLNLWKSIGVNRFSVGVQSTNSKFLEILGRDHTHQETLECLKLLSKENYSLDLILGLPESEKHHRNILNEIDELLKFSPKHFSVYILTPKKGYVLKDKIPADELIAKEYLKVSEHLRANGFDHYEVSNFALNGFKSKHNLKYWQSKNVAAIGPSATGYFNISDVSAIRYKWNNKGDSWSVEELGPEELSLEKLYLSLRTDQGININSTEEQVRSRIKIWEKKGLLKITGEIATLTPSGYLIMDTLLEII